MIQFLRYNIAFFCLLFALSGISQAQAQSASGRDFWVMIAERDADTIVLYVFGDTLADCSINNDHYNYHSSFQVFPGQVTTLKLPSSLVMFDNTIQNANTSFGGILIHSSRNVFLYVQNLRSVPDTFANNIIWINRLDSTNSFYPYLSPLMYTTFSSEKIPIFPISSQQKNRFPDIGEDWWFYRCNPSLESGSGKYHIPLYVTAMEDSTVIIASTYESNPSSSWIPDTNIIVLQKNESTVFVRTAIRCFV